MAGLVNIVFEFLKNDDGISSVEYALLLAFVGAAVIAGAIALSSAVEGNLDGAATCVQTGTSSSC